MTAATSTLAFLSMPGGWEWILILLVALLLFGKRLPEVGKSVGRAIVEFKKGVKGIEDEIEAESSRSAPAPKKLDENRTVSQGAPLETPADAKPNAAH
ncbi:MAG: twin-arginine translocase TatA/TatE family subunit [Phycisphaerales bacterium]